MLEVLFPLHDNFENGLETGCEESFIRSFGWDLSEPVRIGIDRSSHLLRENEEGYTVRN